MHTSACIYIRVYPKMYTIFNTLYYYLIPQRRVFLFHPSSRRRFSPSQPASSVFFTPVLPPPDATPKGVVHAPAVSQWIEFLSSTELLSRGCSRLRESSSLFAANRPSLFRSSPLAAVSCSRAVLTRTVRPCRRIDPRDHPARLQMAVDECLREDWTGKDVSSSRVVALSTHERFA